MFGTLGAAYAAQPRQVDGVQGVRIDVWDSSNGQRPPVFAVSQVHTALTSAFLWFTHGSNQLGCYSLTTGVCTPYNVHWQEHLIGTSIVSIVVTAMMSPGVTWCGHCSRQLLMHLYDNLAARQVTSWL